MQKPNKAHYKQEEVAQKKPVAEKITFIIEDGDVIIQNGPYRGCRVSELWTLGDSAARDYIMTKIWFQRNLEANEIINKMCYT